MQGDGFGECFWRRDVLSFQFPYFFTISRELAATPECFVDDASENSVTSEGWCGVLVILSHYSNLHPNGVLHSTLIICEVKQEGGCFLMRL